MRAPYSDGLSPRGLRPLVYPACAAACTARATSSFRSPLPRTTTPAMTTVHPPMPNGTNIGVTLHADRFARATVIDNANGHRPRYEDPALSCLLRIKEHQSRQRPKRCRYRDLNLLVPCRRPRRQGWGLERGCFAAAVPAGYFPDERSEEGSLFLL